MGGCSSGTPARFRAGWAKDTLAFLTPARNLLAQRANRDWGACDLHAANGPGGASRRQSLASVRRRSFLFASAHRSEGPQTARTPLRAVPRDFARGLAMTSLSPRRICQARAICDESTAVNLHV